MSKTREIDQVDRQASYVIRLAAVALLVGVAVVGCARHDSSVGTSVSTPAPQSSQPTPTTAPVVIVADSPAPGDSVAPSDSVEATPTNVAAAAADQLDGELSNLNNLINGVSSSVSGSDAGISGGE